MWYSKFLWLWFGLGVDELGALLGFYSLDNLVWVWFRVGFPMFALIDALWFGNVHVFFFFQLVWCSCSLTLGLPFDSGFDVVAGLWLLGFDDFLVLNFLGLCLRDLMILLGLKMRTEFLFWAYNFFFELNFLGFFVCLFLKKIYGDEPKEYEHVLQKKIMKEIKFFNLIILFYFKRI